MKAEGGRRKSFFRPPSSSFRLLQIMLRWCLIAIALVIAACASVAHAWGGPIVGFRTLAALLAIFECGGAITWFFLRHVADTGPRPAAVPRRYGVGSLLIVTAVMAMFLSTIQWLGGGPIDMGLGSAYFAAVGIGQAVLFGGKAPRRASMMVGILFPLVVAFTASLCGNIPQMLLLYLGLWRAGIAHRYAVFAFYSVVFGAPAGYLIGSMVAAVFMAIERVWGREEEKDEG